MENPTKIAANYLKVIKAFKNRYDVQNGFALGYRKNQNPENMPKFEDTPKTIGQALTTTGWCVSVSQALLLDNIFQLLLKARESYAKLISIDIKEQYFGTTYSGHQNKWHTAILVKDSNQYLVIDMTCAQFGNAFVEKFIWDLETWEKTFRSPLDTHKLIDFDGSELSLLPLASRKENIIVNKAEAEIKLHNITTITDNERSFLTKFFFEDFSELNKKLYIGNINKFDYNYINNLNQLLKEFDFVVDNEREYYSVLEFSTKDGVKKWIEKLLKNDCITSEYMLFSDTLKKALDYNKIQEKNINSELCLKNYIIITTKSIKGVNIDFIKNVDVLIPIGIKFELDKQTDIYNGGKILQTGTDGNLDRKTNTVYINTMI